MNKNKLKQKTETHYKCINNSWLIKIIEEN